MTSFTIMRFMFCQHATRPVALVLVLGLLASCSSRQVTAPVEAPLRSAPVRDFSGHWEKNYQLSEDMDTRMGLFFSDIQRRAAVQSRQIQGGPVINGPVVNADAVNGLARFAEELTRTALIDITHSEGRISIDRENDYTLRCTYGERQFARISTPFGSEICGWSDERFVFRMSLSDGLQIAHQFSLSPDASMLNVTTTVSSDRVAVPLVISNFYTRYEMEGLDYDCTLTLTRNNVCSQRRSVE